MHLARIHRGKETISTLQHVACRLPASAGRQVASPGPGGLSCRRHLVRHRDHLRLAARPDRVLRGELRDQFGVGLRLAMLGPAVDDAEGVNRRRGERVAVVGIDSGAPRPVMWRRVAEFIRTQIRAKSS